MSRLGLMGGSFDPPHLGHLWIATFAREQLGLESVLLMPASHPPHKTDGTTAPYQFRLDLVRMLGAKRPWLVASDLEADASRPSYTVETLRKLSSGLDAGTELTLLLGGDSVVDFPSWHKPEEIVSLASIGIYGRPGHTFDPPGGARVHLIDGPACGLSSTLIRERLKAGLSIEGMVPDEILEPILQADFYR